MAHLDNKKLKIFLGVNITNRESTKDEAENFVFLMQSFMQYIQLDVEIIA